MYYRIKLFEFYNHNTYLNAKIPIYLDISLSYYWFSHTKFSSICVYQNSSLTQKQKYNVLK